MLRNAITILVFQIKRIFQRGIFLKCQKFVAGQTTLNEEKKRMAEWKVKKEALIV